MFTHEQHFLNVESGLFVSKVFKFLLMEK
jgi:hypothetical protein